MRHKPRQIPSNCGSLQDRWLVSYTDMLTILFILFVSVSAQVMRARVAPPAPPQARSVLREAEQRLQAQNVDAHLEPRGLVTSLPQAVLFASGDDRVKPEALPSIAKIAGVITETNNKVALVGHADTTPIHNRRFRDNWELSAARSLKLLELLTTEYGIAESRLSIQSEGANHPRDSNGTETGRAANRRVEILILNDP